MTDELYKGLDLANNQQDRYEFGDRCARYFAALFNSDGNISDICFSYPYYITSPVYGRMNADFHQYYKKKQCVPAVIEIKSSFNPPNDGKYTTGSISYNYLKTGTRANFFVSLDYYGENIRFYNANEVMEALSKANNGNYESTTFASLEKFYGLRPMNVDEYKQALINYFENQ